MWCAGPRVSSLWTYLYHFTTYFLPSGISTSRLPWLTTHLLINWRRLSSLYLHSQNHFVSVRSCLVDALPLRFVWDFAPLCSCRGQRKILDGDGGQYSFFLDCYGMPPKAEYFVRSSNWSVKEQLSHSQSSWDCSLHQLNYFQDSMWRSSCFHVSLHNVGGASYSFKFCCRWWLGR